MAAAVPDAPQDEDRPVLLLVHGGHHGSWCWDLLVPELERLGWSTQTVDLPVSDPSLGAADYVESIVSQVDPVPCVAIGHSMAGVVIPLLVDRLPVQGLVFLNAMTPVPGKSVSQQYQDEPEAVGSAAAGIGGYQDGVRYPDPDGARALYYHDCSDDLSEWALAQLVPQAAKVITEVTPLTVWPDVPSACIVGVDDRAVPRDWAVGAARRRLDVEAVEMEGGHSPFLARPKELARVLDATVEELLERRRMP